MSKKQGILGAIIMAGLAYATGGASLTIMGHTFTAMQSFLIRAGLGIALNALAPKPSAQAQGYNVTQRGSALDHQIVYGRTKVAGAIVYDGTTGSSNKYLHRVLAFTGHEIDSFDEIWLNDYKLTVNSSTGAVTNATKYDEDGNSVETTTRYNGYVRIKQKLGASNQAAEADLVNEVAEWTSNHRLRGISYLYVRLKFDSDVFPNGIPEIQATIKGKKVYDPRTQTTGWSDNPALCIRDYLVSEYGLDEASSFIDDDTVIAAANRCDETSSNNDPFFTMNGAFVTSKSPADTLQEMLVSMGGMLWYAQGKWRMKAADWTTPLLTLNEDDLRGPVSVGTRHSRRDSFNIIRGTWRGAKSDWQITDFPEYKVAQAISDDGGLESVLDLPLQYTDTPEEAQRIARIMYERNRQQLTVQAEFGLRAFEMQVGDFVQFNYDRMGWTSAAPKYWEVVEWSFGMKNEDLIVNATLREVSSDVFDEIDNYVIYERDNTTLASPFDTQTVSVASPVVSSQLAEDGTVIPKVKWTWSVTDESQVDYYIFGWRIGASGLYNEHIIQDKQFEIEPAVAGATYYYSVKSVSYNGVTSAAQTGNVTATGDTVAPSTPTLNNPYGGYQAITLSWAAPSEADFKHMQIQRSDNGSTGWATVGYASGTGWVDGNVGNDETKYYRIRAIDFSDNTSSYTSAKSATTISEVTGPSGYTQAQVFLYRASTSTPSDPSGTFTYTFATGALTGGTLNGWSTSVPNLSTNQYLWVKTASAYSNTATDSIPASEFSSAVKTSYSAEDGAAGYNSATVTLYKKTSTTSTPTKPTTSETYTFSSGSLTATDNEWTQTAPSLSAGQYLWAITAVAYSQSNTDTIAASEWSSPSIVGIAGATGASGARGAGRWDIELTDVEFATVDQSTESGNVNSLFVSNIGTPVDKDQAWFRKDDGSQAVWIYDSGTSSWNWQNEIIDGNLIVSGTITADDIQTGTLDASEVTITNLTIEDTLRLEAGGAGFIGGRDASSDYATDGFYMARTDKGGGNKGYELSATSVYDDSGTNRISGIINRDTSQTAIINPLFYIGGTASGGTTTMSGSNTSDNLGQVDEVTVNVYGGGGGGGYGVGDGSGSGRGGSGGTTTVTVRRGSTTGTIIATISASGGLGGLNGQYRIGSGGAGGTSDFGLGGAGGAKNTQGATATNLASGGGGGGGDSTNFLDPNSGLSGYGGEAGQKVTQTIDTSAYSEDIYIVASFGAGGTGGVGGFEGGDGAAGAVSYASVLGGTTQYALTDFLFGSANISAGTVGTSTTNTLRKYAWSSQYEDYQVHADAAAVLYSADSSDRRAQSIKLFTNGQTFRHYISNDNYSPISCIEITFST